eukprot:957632-Prorocentrum_minimum.AAC.1
MSKLRNADTAAYCRSSMAGSPDGAASSASSAGVSPPAPATSPWAALWFAMLPSAPAAYA